MTDTPQWLAWAREIHSLSQAGLTYSQNEYDLERYRRLQEIAAEIVAGQSELSKEAVLESFAMQPGYITPKIDVRAAVFRDGKILLVQESADNCWSMPSRKCRCRTPKPYSLAVIPRQPIISGAPRKPSLPNVSCRSSKRPPTASASPSSTTASPARAPRWDW